MAHLRGVPLFATLAVSEQFSREPVTLQTSFVESITTG